MTRLDVLRSSPPALGHCRACSARIEWVTTVPGDRKMPVDAPLVSEGPGGVIGGRVVTVIDAARSHFATCPEAARFSRRKR